MPALEAALGGQRAAGRKGGADAGEAEVERGDAVEAGAAELQGEAGGIAAPGEAALGHHRFGGAAGQQPGIHRLGLQAADAEAAVLQPRVERAEPGRGAEAGQRQRRPGQRDVAADQDQLARLQPAGQQRGEVEPEAQAAGGDADAIGGGADRDLLRLDPRLGEQDEGDGTVQLDRAAEPGAGEFRELRPPGFPVQQPRHDPEGAGQQHRRDAQAEQEATRPGWVRRLRHPGRGPAFG